MKQAAIKTISAALIATTLAGCANMSNVSRPTDGSMTCADILKEHEELRGQVAGAKLTDVAKLALFLVPLAGFVAMASGSKADEIQARLRVLTRIGQKMEC